VTNLLTVNVSPEGLGHIFVNGNYAASGQTVGFSKNSTVLLSASAKNGYKFSYWSDDLTGSDNPSNIVMTCNKLVTAHFVPLVTVETTPIYYPHIACSNGWKSEICLVNGKNSNLSGYFYAYDDNGNLLEISRRVTLAAFGRVELSVGQDFAEAANIGYIIFAAETESLGDIVGYTKFYIEKHFRTAIPAVTQINQKNIFIPHIALDDSWWTGISLINTTSESETLTIRFDTGATLEIDLKAKEHRVFSLGDFLEHAAVSGVHSAVIRNAAGMVAVELFGRGDQLSGVLLNDQTADEIFYPQIAENEWWTGVALYNAEPISGTLNFTAYNNSGAMIGEAKINLAGYREVVRSVADLNFPADAAWFSVKSDQPIVGCELFGKVDGSQLAGFSGVAISGLRGVFPSIADNGYTGIALVNVTDKTASLTLTAYKDDGTVVSSKLVALAGHEKMVGDVQAFFSEDISPATYVSYQSDRELAGFQINGSGDGMMLDALPALR